MAYALRDYQSQCADAILRDFETNQSTLAVLPTGTGKTVVLAEVIRRFREREGSIIMLAHRQELLTQAQKVIESHVGCQCEFEQGERRASEIFTPDVVLASIQTLISGRNGQRRMHKFSPFDYSLVIIDETHHVTAASYLETLNHFKANEDVKILGVTATPGRADEESLGRVYQSVSYDLPILQAIKDGWLVPVQQQLIDIESLDFSHVRTTAGDLNGADLAAVMESERNLYGICDAAMRELKPEDKAIMFCATVKQAEMATDILNRYRTGIARFASGKTPTDERRAIMRAFSEGRYQIFVNCNLVSEGFDVPDANKLFQARPTKSPLLYTQQLGRIMRPLPGTVDEGGDASFLPRSGQSSAAPTSDPAARRRALIAASPKPVAVVMDFVGNAGRHKLVHAIDILGGEISEELRELAERTARATGRPTAIDEMVMEAEQKLAAERRQKEAARKARLTARAKYTTRFIDPFNAFDVVAPPTRAWDSGKTLSEKQRALLRKQSIDPDTLTYAQGKALLNEMFRRFGAKLATLKQCACLKRFGVDTHDLTMKQASEMIDKIAANGWRAL